MTISDKHRSLTAKQTAEFLHMHPQTVRRLLAAKKLPGRRIGKCWFVDAVALAKLVSIPWPDEQGGASSSAASTVATPQDENDDCFLLPEAPGLIYEEI